MEITDQALDRLLRAIESARTVLSDHSDYVVDNETRTRVLLVDRLLAALDWDIGDPTRVWLEHRANGGRADYVLLSAPERCLAVVEAKPVNAAHGGRQLRQASGYADALGARYAVLTNGARWEAWEMVPSEPRKDHVIAEVNIRTGDLETEVAATLSALHRDVLLARSNG